MKRRQFHNCVVVRLVVTLGLLLAVGLWGLPGCGANNPASSPYLRVGVETEPSTWNPLLANDLLSVQITRLIHAPLMRVDPKSQRVQPVLAKSWSFSDDGTGLDIELHDNLAFSDGSPFSADDVVFTFELLRHPDVVSQLTSTVTIDGRVLVPEKTGSHSVRFSLPLRLATMERLFDPIGILPRHLLEDALEQGHIETALGLGNSEDQVVGLGPFVLKDYQPGRQVLLGRNPHGTTPVLGQPGLEGIAFEIAAEAQTNVLRFLGGELDLLTRLTPAAFQSIRRAREAAVGVDSGPGLTSERLWFNLNPEAPLPAHKRAWFRSLGFRQAVSAALDRPGMARVVYAGYATPASGTLSPASPWRGAGSSSAIPQDIAFARRALKSADFRWQGEQLLGPEGHPVSFRLMTSPAPTRRQLAEFIQQDLAELGMEVKIAVLEGGALMSSLLGSFDYDASLLGITQTDPDPSAEMPIWMSSAPLHLWHPRQSAPMTPWEAEIDRLMKGQLRALDVGERRRLYAGVHRIVQEQLPVMDLLFPHMLIAVSGRVRGLDPTPLAEVLWNSEGISLAGRLEGAVFAPVDR